MSLMQVPQAGGLGGGGGGGGGGSDKSLFEINSKSQQFMNVVKNGSVSNAFVQNMAFFLKRQGEDDNKWGWTIFKKHHSDKSHNMTSIGIGFIIIAPAHDLNNWTRLCWGEACG